MVRDWGTNTQPGHRKHSYSHKRLAGGASVGLGLEMRPWADTTRVAGRGACGQRGVQAGGGAGGRTRTAGYCLPGQVPDTGQSKL